MRRRLSTRVVAASAVLALLITGSFAVLVDAIRDLRESGRLAERAAEVNATANELERLAIDLQSGVRGFAITRNDAFLAPVRNARVRYPIRARQLDSLILDPAQKRRARSIVERIRAYDRDFAARVVAATRVDPARGRALIATGEGKRRVDALRNAFERFRAAESTIVARRDARVTADARRATELVAVSLIGSLVLIALFAA